MLRLPTNIRTVNYLSASSTNAPVRYSKENEAYRNQPNYQQTYMSIQPKQYVWTYAAFRKSLYLNQQKQEKSWQSAQNVATPANFTKTEDAAEPLRRFSFATAENQEDNAYMELSYPMTPDDNCDCFTLPDELPEGKYNVWECTDDGMTWGMVRFRFSDSSCYDLEFPQEDLYGSCSQENSVDYDLCMFVFALDEGSASLAEEPPIDTSVVSEITTAPDAILTSSSSSPVITDEPTQEPSSSQPPPNEATSTPSTSAPPVSATTRVGVNIGHLLTFVMVTVLAFQ